MEQSGESRIAATREEVWAALNDPDVLARCLDGCQSMERVADDQFHARVKAKVGPVRATFDADLTLTDVEPPHSYTINGNLKGGPAGFARGSARVVLTDTGADTLLAYTVNASIGGKLAQVGSRLIDGTARKMADDFFAQFREEVESAGRGEAEAVAGAGDQAPEDVPPAPAPPGGERTSGAEPVPPPEPSATVRAPGDPSHYESGGKWMIWVGVFAALLVALVLAF